MTPEEMEAAPPVRLTAREEYTALIRQAKHYEDLASDDAVGGPSHWRDARENVIKAIATPWHPVDDNLSPGQAALRQAFQDLEACDLLWRKAAVILRAQAQALRQRLLSEALLIEQQLAEIDAAGEKAARCIEIPEVRE